MGVLVRLGSVMKVSGSTIVGSALVLANLIAKFVM